MSSTDVTASEDGQAKTAQTTSMIVNQAYVKMAPNASMASTPTPASARLVILECSARSRQCCHSLALTRLRPDHVRLTSVRIMQCASRLKTHPTTCVNVRQVGLLTNTLTTQLVAPKTSGPSWTVNSYWHSATVKKASSSSTFMRTAKWR